MNGKMSARYIEAAVQVSRQ